MMNCLKNAIVGCCWNHNYHCNSYGEVAGDSYLDKERFMDMQVIFCGQDMM